MYHVSIHNKIKKTRILEFICPSIIIISFDDFFKIQLILLTSMGKHGGMINDIKNHGYCIVNMIKLKKLDIGCPLVGTQP